MSTRVSPIERIRAEIDDLFGSERELGEVLEEVARLGVRLLMQTAIEAEVTEFLGRERYSHGERVRQGSRNGHCPTTVKSTAGPVKIDRPKLRGTDEAFASRLLGVGVCRTNALESLVIAGFVRGLSVRDVEASLADALGAEAALSKSTVSRVCEAIKDEFDTWKCRDLSEVALEYLFLDGSVRHEAPYVGGLSDPQLVRSLGTEVPLDQVPGRRGRLVPPGGVQLAPPALPRDTQLSHEPGHLLLVGLHARLEQRRGHPRRPVTTTRASPGVEDPVGQDRLFDQSVRGALTPGPPRVIRRGRHLRHPTQRADSEVVRFGLDETVDPQPLRSRHGEPGQPAGDLGLRLQPGHPPDQLPHPWPAGALHHGHLPSSFTQ